MAYLVIINLFIFSFKYLHMKLLVTKIGLFLPILVLVVLLNYFVDPANLFKGKNYEKGIAKILLEGKNIGNIDNYNERFVQKFYINDLSERKDIVVIGSSRSMDINSQLFGVKSFFNNSMPGASLEDYYAIYGLYKKRGLLPIKIIIGIDPWIFDENSKEKRWMDISDSFYYASETKSNNFKIIKYLLESKLYKFSSLLSFSYFQNSIMNLITHQNPGEYYLTDLEEGKDTIRHADNSISYKKSYRDMSIEQSNYLANKYLENRYFPENIGNLDMFENYIHNLRNDNIRVYFFLPPYHPDVYNTMKSSAKYDVVFKIQEYLETFAKDNKIEIIGSYNPYNLNLSEKDFFDGQHCRNQVINRIFLEANTTLIK